jgi:hypothetical protein
MSTDRTATDHMIAKYRKLISTFIDRQISAEEFQSSYFLLFKNDEEQVPGLEFKILDKLFADVDDYTADPELRKVAGGLDDEELRNRARDVYRKLYE